MAENSKFKALYLLIGSTYEKKVFSFQILLAHSFRHRHEISHNIRNKFGANFVTHFPAKKNFLKCKVVVKFQIDRPKMKKVIRTPSFLLSHMPTVNRSDEPMDFFQLQF